MVFNGKKVKKVYLIIVLVFLLKGNMFPLHAQDVPSDSLVKECLRGWGVPITEQNCIKLLKSGKAKFADMFEAVSQAKHHIHLEYFNFRNDSIAGALFELLAQKAAQGVEVRALFDAFGNMSNNQPLREKHLRRIRACGIEIYKFDPIRFPYVNHVLKRDHRKIVVIDGREAYTGGMNVADYYLHGTEQVGTWRDMHMWIKGPAVADLQRIFLKIWNKTSGQKIEGEAYFPNGERIDNDSLSRRNVVVDLPVLSPIGIINDSVSFLSCIKQELDTVRLGIGPIHSQVELAIVDREPDVTPQLIRRAYVTSIGAAQEKIQLINPYFVPTHSIKKALKQAVKRGVDVQIMISATSDIPFTPDASMYFAYKLVKKGAKVYLFNNGFHHSKIMMVDDDFCTLGSANLNSRSLRYDYEVNAFIFDKEVTGELIQMFETDKLDSIELTREIWKKRSPWKRFLGWFANIFAPVL